jgi:hypothetical protein
MNYEILIVDDLPIIVDGYINLLSKTDFQENKPNFIKAIIVKMPTIKYF